jgi:hypothetical protein
MMTFVKEVQEIFFPKLYIQLIAKKALGLIILIRRMGSDRARAASGVIAR